MKNKWYGWLGEYANMDGLALIYAIIAFGFLIIGMVTGFYIILLFFLIRAYLHLLKEIKNK